MIVWHEKDTGLVLGTGDASFALVDGVMQVDSPSWDKDKQDYLIGFQGTIEGEGPWWLWGDGNLHPHEEGVVPPLSLEKKVELLQADMDVVKDKIK